jgi:surfeit locus 1 family protein
MPNRRSHPIVSLIITLFFCTLFIGLGCWQLQRASEQQQHTRILEQGARQGVLPIDAVIHLAKLDDYPVQATGHFDNAHSILLDNRIYQDQAGYDVITPFQTETGLWLLVNRGWLPRGPDRTHLPSIPSISGNVEVTGRTHLPEHNIFLPEPHAQKAPLWPLRLAEVDVAMISHQLDHKFLPVTLRLDKLEPTQQNADLPQDWQRPIRFTPARHRFYALQWFAFAGIAFGLYFTLTLRGRNAQDKTQETSTPP